jgi:hypothetical protein
LQAWLPGRTSSALDLILNTLGAWLGILLYNIIQRPRRDTFKNGGHDKHDKIGKHPTENRVIGSSASSSFDVKWGKGRNGTSAALYP